jgi:LacI family transcriptional regulator
MIRLKDIAEKAGVSVMTVSKALRDAKDISVKTKARIRQLSLEMGYVPDAMAQSLRTRSTRLLGVLIASSTNPIFSRTLMALEEWGFQLGYEILVSHSLNQPDREETASDGCWRGGSTDSLSLRFTASNRPRRSTRS